MGSFAKTLVFNLGLKPKPLLLALQPDVNKMGFMFLAPLPSQQTFYLFADASGNIS